MKIHSIKIMTILMLCILLFSNVNASEKKLKNGLPIRESEIINSNDPLLDTIQKQTFNYFWEGAEPNSGLARERIHMDDVYPTSPKNTVTTGGSGFGMMALLVGIKRGYITREAAFNRFEKMVDFLEKADRFHGAWPHWLNGETGKVVPFSKQDNGGDLVETAFLIQGMLTVKAYFKDGTTQEKQLATKIDQLWRGVEWDWYTKGENVLYWHWSPTDNWDMNFPIGGYNECLVMYVLAAASPTHSISKEVYDQGWARNGEIVSKDSFYDIPLVLNYYENEAADIGPMFWGHYSYVGLNPKGLKDQYADYWEVVQNQARIHHAYAIDNPKNFKGYGDSLWGMSSSYSVNGYDAHRPGNDLGVITPTAALASFPYTPKESMNMLKYLYTEQDSLIGKYGPYDAFSLEDNWYVPRYLAIDQGPITIMIENYRSGMLWDLFMQNEDVKRGLNKLGFTSENYKLE